MAIVSWSPEDLSAEQRKQDAEDHAKYSKYYQRASKIMTFAWLVLAALLILSYSMDGLHPGSTVVLVIFTGALITKWRFEYLRDVTWLEQTSQGHYIASEWSYCQLEPIETPYGEPRLRLIDTVRPGSFIGVRIYNPLLLFSAKYDPERMAPALQLDVTYRKRYAKVDGKRQWVYELIECTERA